MMLHSLTCPPILQLLCVCAPALLILGLCVPRARRACCRLTPLAAVPALLLALFGSGAPGAPILGLHMETHLQLDPMGRCMLLLTALVWGAASIHATGYFKGAPRQTEFFTFFLAAMSGNLLLTIAADAVTFYAAFAVMSFASYGLVAFTGTASARRASLVYIVLVVVGEAIVFSALIQGCVLADSILLADVRTALSQSPNAFLLACLVLVGFGIKAGVMPFHVWLPLAHPAAPTPASAVLSGCMIKAGVLGWLRVLPLGEIAMPNLAILAAVTGVLTSLAALAIGLTQQNPKSLLAYSSIAKMGVVLLMVALLLDQPSLMPYALTSIGVYVLFHALAKGTLFLGCSVTPQAADAPGKQRLLCAGLILSALAFAGAPYLAGVFAKAGLKTLIGKAPLSWVEVIGPAFALIGVLTAFLMARFVYLTWPRRAQGAAQHVPQRAEIIAWSGLLVVVLAFPWGVGLGVAGFGVNVQTLLAKAVAPASTLAALWPILVAIVISLFIVRRKISIALHVVPGDVLALYVKCLRLISLLVPPLVVRFFTRSDPLILHFRIPETWHAFGRVCLDHGERQLRRWPVSGMYFLLILMLVIILAIT